jgi:hypothetical protein
MDRLMRHRQTKGPETDRPNLHHRATSRLHINGELHKKDNPVYGRDGLIASSQVHFDDAEYRRQLE